MADKNKPSQKLRTTKTSNHIHGAGGKVKLTDLQKFLLTGKSTRGMKIAGRVAQLHTEEQAKQKLAEKRKKQSGHEAFQKLASGR